MVTTDAESSGFLSHRSKFLCGADSPTALLERCLAAITEADPRIHAFTHVAERESRHAAAQSTSRWIEGRPLSPIDGMPLGIKDIIDTADMPTEYGSTIFAGHRPLIDAASVIALRRAGAVIVGKTVTTEFAGGVPGPTRNPWDLHRTPGGSSSGSAAAVGSGMIPAALGTQALGSIIRPASYCGAFAFKPSVGALNRGGVLDLNSQSVLGVIADDLTDVWIVARQISHRVGGDPGYPGLLGPILPPPAIKPRRLALLDYASLQELDSTVRQELRTASCVLAAAGVEMVDRTDSESVEELEGALDSVRRAASTITGRERAWMLEAYRSTNQGALRSTTLERIGETGALAQEDYVSALRTRARLRAFAQSLRPQFDGILTLSTAGPAPHGLESTGDPMLSILATFLGAPAVTIPALRLDGLPYGLQLIGHRRHDVEAIAMARWITDHLAVSFIAANPGGRRSET